MTRPATKIKALVAVFSCLIFAEAALSQALSNLYRITGENGGDIGAINDFILGHVRSTMYVVDQAAPGVACTAGVPLPSRLFAEILRCVLPAEMISMAAAF